MKKLKELTKEELRSLYDHNEDFRYECYKHIEEDKGLMIEDRHSEYFEKDASGYRYNDHYNSFFYTLTDAEQFCKGVKRSARDYFDTEAQKSFDKMFSLYDKWQDMTWEEQDENDDLYNELEEEAKKVLKYIEEDLKSFEDITDEDISYELENILNNDCIMAEWETDGEKIYWEEIHILQ